jgi:hypothetical protein
MEPVSSETEPSLRNEARPRRRLQGLLEQKHLAKMQQEVQAQAEDAQAQIRESQVLVTEILWCCSPKRGQPALLLHLGSAVPDCLLACRMQPGSGDHRSGRGGEARLPLSTKWWTRALRSLFCYVYCQRSATWFAAAARLQQQQQQQQQHACTHDMI